MSADAITALGPVESASTLLRSGSRRRAVLASNSATCDLYVLGGDRLLHMYNPKGGGLRCVQVLRPQLLDEAFLRRHPGFWDQPGYEQEQLVRDAYGPAATLDVPHEVVEAKLHEGSGLLALVGVHRVSVMLLPSSASVSAQADAPDALSAMLSTLGLAQYAEALRTAGYSHVTAMLRMSREEREAMAQQAGMLPGHAQTLMMVAVLVAVIVVVDVVADDIVDVDMSIVHFVCCPLRSRDPS